MRQLLISFLLPLWLAAFATSSSHAQGKPACELTTKSDLESIMGFPFKGPQSSSVDNLLPDASLPNLITSSSCVFETALPETKKFNNGVQITVRYMRDADPDSAKEMVVRVLKNKTDSRPLEVPGLGYPAFYLSLNSSMYVFKGGTSGSMLLQVVVHGAPSEASSRNPSTWLGELLDREKKIALRILGAPAKPAGVVANDQIMDADDALKGQSAVSVVVHIAGMRGISEAVLRNDIVAQLRKLGITVFPEKDPPKFPLLALNVDALIRERVGSAPVTIYTLSLEFQQLFPVQTTSGSTKFVVATTWNTGSFGVTPTLWEVSPIRREVGGLTSQFAKVHRAVNHQNR